nr:MAG TPA: hypothetical protein [Caudoviricetes sp.]
MVNDFNDASKVETLVVNALRSDIRANLAFILDQSVSSPVLLSTSIDYVFLYLHLVKVI